MRASSGAAAVFGAIVLTPTLASIGDLGGYEIPIAACLALGIDRLIRTCAGGLAHG